MTTMLNFIRRSFATTTRPLNEIYREDVRKTGKVLDPIQLDIVHSLQRLHDDIVRSHGQWQSVKAKMPTVEPVAPIPIIKKPVVEEAKPFSFFSFSARTQQNKKQEPKIERKSSAPMYVSSLPRVKGLYLYGGSGCGKTYLSQLFFHNLPIKQKTKIHFHEFMAGIQRQLFKLEQNKKSYDPLSTIAQEKSKTTRLLFLDEFQVTDVADATILKRLFERLINYDLVLLATSNRAPEDLYKNGHQREHFVPFISFLRQKCQIKEVDTDKDYRYDLQKQTDTNKRYYLSPINEQTDKRLERLFCILAGVKTMEYQPLIVEPIAGRKLKIPRSKNGVCMYDFDELCDNIMSDLDFRAICRSHKVIIVRHIPKIETGNRNVANRFIKLVNQNLMKLDEVYVNNDQFICSAEVPLAEVINTLKPEETVTEEEFAINRCKSRLVEFQAKSYREKKSYYQQHLN